MEDTNEKETKILNNRIFLYITEFFAGMAVMAVELGASRLLAPYFSSSQIVWTIIIGTIMIAMAAGNLYGGRSADKDPNPDKLYMRIVIAAIWIAVIPVLGKYIIVLISGALVLTINTGFLVIAAFIACMVIFVFPLFLLGTVTPSLVKYTTSNLEDNGKVVGTLGAANTIGSIIGTFLPTFVTIPAVGTAVTFLVFSGIILLIGIIYFVCVRRNLVRLALFLIVFVLCAILGNKSNFAFWEKNLVYEGESIYNYTQVKEDENSVSLSTNVMFGVQSVALKKAGLTGMYYDYAMAAPVAAGVDEKKCDVLVLGMGTGTFAKQCNYFFGSDKLNIRGVEIDDKISGLAEKYFGAKGNVPVTTYDGRAFIKVDKEKYDVIMVDAYQDITIPFQMSSREFFEEVYAHLKEDGVMVVNLNMRAEGAKDSINDYMCDTIASVFPDVQTVDVKYSTNRELFATKKKGSFEGRFGSGISKINVPQLREFMSMIEYDITPYKKGDKLLTDDQAPVELLGMREIDLIIKKELEYYKKVYEEKGLNGLLNGM